MSDSLPSHGLYSPWNSPGQNTGVGSCSFLQGILPTQGSNPGLLHCRCILYHLSQKGSPRITEWVVSTCGGSSRPRNRAGVSCIAGGFFTREVLDTQRPNQLTTWKQYVFQLNQMPSQTLLANMLASLFTDLKKNQGFRHYKHYLLPYHFRTIWF